MKISDAKASSMDILKEISYIDQFFQVGCHIKNSEIRKETTSGDVFVCICICGAQQDRMSSLR